MEGIIEALVDAGYFRARISTLSDFDKIIGGVAWAMQVFSYGLNINIFYADTLDLGQKIALTERLVMVLLVMNCPHQVEPHQIVGLDYTNLLPVIRWLIKRSAEVRQEHEAFNRLMALRYFHRVTNSSSSRAEWCHVIPIEHLEQPSRTEALSERVGGSGVVLSTGATEPTLRLFTRLEEEFSTNKQVSFVKLPGLFRNVTRGQEDHLNALREEDEEEGSDESSQGCLGGELEDRGQTAGVLVNRSEEETSAKFSKAADRAFPDNDEQVELHRELDTELLATNQKILNLLKKLDSMPNQLEIGQYQKRYIELHQQLISKNRDMKKLYALFNSLDSIRHYLTKEINLLDSILSNLDLTTNSAVHREQFSTQFRDIIIKIQDVRDDVVARLEVIRAKCEALSSEYASILN